MEDHLESEMVVLTVDSTAQMMDCNWAVQLELLRAGSLDQLMDLRSAGCLAD